MTKLKEPKTEQELRKLLDELYKIAKENKENRQTQKFKGILEVITSETVILTAIHNIKSNKGSKTVGVDKIDIDHILQGNLEKNIRLIQDNIKRYEPKHIRRVYITKSNGKLRPLGIPTIMDRIIQECIRIVIEPILEAQFFNHSYGFRPYREASHAVERVIYINNRIGFHWAVEGDIKGCFDNMNHRIMIKQLYNMGIKDRRVLAIITAMLKSPINDNGEIIECNVGIPQGGILSPLLANAYMHKLDMWVSREWELKKLRTAKTRPTQVLRRNSTINNPEFFVRYADDWVLLTKTKSNAEYWKHKIKMYLRNTMKLELSDEKTHITDMRKKAIKFVGFRIKVLPKGKKGKLVGYSYPIEERLVEKLKQLQPQFRKIKYASNSEWRVHEINILNSKLRGIINYYSSATGVNESMRKYREWIKYSSYKSVSKRGGQWIPINQCSNLKVAYRDRTEQVPAIKIDNEWIGIITLSVATWNKVPCFNQDMTPYTQTGRELYMIKNNKTPLLTRVQELLDTPYSGYIQNRAINNKRNRLYTLEFYLNRCYAFNRDKGKCKICGDILNPRTTETHHINDKLPDNKINKVTNLASVCMVCHHNIHSNIDSNTLYSNKKQIDKLKKSKTS
ncbi:MAG: group II intron reverse transcriptase/maturase, partial [Clostridia bacterium]|nr:group II intron reverse transcriptase/maturase [Clostridia bacterium]